MQTRWQQAASQPLPDHSCRPYRHAKKWLARSVAPEGACSGRPHPVPSRCQPHAQSHPARRRHAKERLVWSVALEGACSRRSHPAPNYCQPRDPRTLSRRALAVPCASDHLSRCVRLARASRRDGLPIACARLQPPLARLRAPRAMRLARRPTQLSQRRLLHRAGCLFRSLRICTRNGVPPGLHRMLQRRRQRLLLLLLLPPLLLRLQQCEGRRCRSEALLHCSHLEDLRTGKRMRVGDATWGV